MSNEDRARSFTLEVERFLDGELPAIALQVSQKIALDGLTRVVNRTPVDTGRARGGWQVGLGAEPEDETGREDKDGNPTIADGSDVIDRAEPFQSIAIANNVEYIEFLEDGTSQQAPEGMVAVTLAELETIFSRVDDA